MSKTFIDICFDSLRALAKIALRSRRCRLKKAAGASDTLIILANGPSLNDTIASHLPLLRQSDTLAVNMAANAPVFRELQPNYYLLADPYFFSGKDDENLRGLWTNIAGASWPMTLFVPAKDAAKAKEILKNNGAANITLQSFNAVGIEGFRSLTHAAFRRRMAMPRPRNVLIPSIMAGIWLGYKKIVLTGADHSWLETLSVSDDNEVISVQKHFYADNSRELTRVRHEYRNYTIDQILESMAIAFRSYHQIAAYARRAGVSILNATPGSYIDAFPRTNL